MSTQKTYDNEIELDQVFNYHRTQKTYDSVIE